MNIDDYGLTALLFFEDFSNMHLKSLSDINCTLGKFRSISIRHMNVEVVYVSKDWSNDGQNQYFRVELNAPDKYMRHTYPIEDIYNYKQSLIAALSTSINEYVNNVKRESYIESLQKVKIKLL